MIWNRAKGWGVRRAHTEALLTNLRARGLISQITSEATDVPEKKQLGVYLGADPTADSLHLGNLMPFMVLMHFYLRGHRVLPLVGGATGIVGDPSGRTTERTAMAAQQREQNVQKIAVQMTDILHNCRSVASKYREVPTDIENNIQPVNNNTWWKDVNMLWFLGTFGRHIRLSSMLARESVRQRLNSEAGMGYNEFSYQILQSYDFYHLYTNYGCQCQIGGHDQWGNITAGVELINRLQEHKKAENEPLGITVPLLLTPSGEKFGKSAGNAIFLSAERTTPYHLYQYLVKSPDAVVEQYLKVFTFIPLEEIDTLMARHRASPELRLAQHRLASEVTELVHGRAQAESAATISAAMFGEAGMTAREILAAFKSQKLSHAIPRVELIGGDYKSILSRLSGRSKSEAQRLVKNGSVYIGPERNVLSTLKIEDHHISDGEVLLIRVGKTEYYVIEATQSVSST